MLLRLGLAVGVFFVLGTAGLAIADSACCGGADECPMAVKAASATTQPATQPAAAYTCPMHSDVTSDQPGKCPKCGMTLVPKKTTAPAPAPEH